MAQRGEVNIYDEDGEGATKKRKNVIARCVLMQAQGVGVTALSLLTSRLSVACKRVKGVYFHLPHSAPLPPAAVGESRQARPAAKRKACDNRIFNRSRLHTKTQRGVSTSNNAKMAAPNPGDPSGAELDAIVASCPPSITLPPRSVRSVIEKTAGYVARNGAVFEEKVRSSSNGGAKLSFLNPDDDYRPFYVWRLAEIKEGRGTQVSAGRENESTTGVSGKGREERKGPDKPDDFTFSARMPNIAAQDLDIVKLTALFVAQNGRSWMTTLSQREAGNYQFDFLRAQHSLYQFFSRLVDQYTALLTGSTLDNGRPQAQRVAELEANTSDRFHVLGRARKRAEYVKYQEAQKIAAAEGEEAEKKAFAEIDWHDFVVVETVVFDERDEEAVLPPPTTLNDLQSASLEQKASFSIDHSRRIEEAVPLFFGNEDDSQPPPQAQSQPPPVQPLQPPPNLDPAAARRAELDSDRARARAAKDATSLAPKIRSNDYIPRAQAKKASAPQTSICPICGLSIPNDEIDKHIRIERLDPNWREQARKAEMRSSTTNLSTADVANNLKRLASQREDLFDSSANGARGGLSEEEEKRRKRVEMTSYDGQGVAVGFAAAAGVMGETGQGGAGTTTDVQEQIRKLHERYKG